MIFSSLIQILTNPCHLQIYLCIKTSRDIHLEESQPIEVHGPIHSLHPDEDEGEEFPSCRVYRKDHHQGLLVDPHLSNPEQETSDKYRDCHFDVKPWRVFAKESFCKESEEFFSNSCKEVKVETSVLPRQGLFRFLIFLFLIVFNVIEVFIFCRYTRIHC